MLSLTKSNLNPTKDTVHENNTKVIYNSANEKNLYTENSSLFLFLFKLFKNNAILKNNIH